MRRIDKARITTFIAALVFMGFATNEIYPFMLKGYALPIQHSTKMALLFLSGCLSMLLLGVSMIVLELICIFGFKTHLHGFWENIFWPYIAADLKEDKVNAYRNWVRETTITGNNPFLTYVGGEFNKIFYLNPATYCQILMKDGKMEVQTGPLVKTNACNNQTTMHGHFRPLLVNIDYEQREHSKTGE